MSEIKEIFSEKFIAKLLSNINLKIYNWNASEMQNRRKANYKNYFKLVYREKYNRILQKEAMADGGTARGDGVKDDEDEKLLNDMPKDEREIVETFLKSFIMQSDSAKKKDQVDIKLMLKAMMTKVDEFNVFRCLHFDNECIYSALIDYGNDGTLQLFKFFDSKNKMRLNKLQLKATQTQR